jgi:phosphopantothenoylcysteine decarboxylase/phosphopantothenate--cysteine ligase
MDPAEGPLNNGDVGVGRFPEVFEILDYLTEQQLLKSDLIGKEVVITAGGTREEIDPVRFIGNRSSGKQGIALAQAAAQRGARVKLIAANISEALVPIDKAIEIINVESTAELSRALDQIASFDLLFMAAAVADYRPAHVHSSKLKRDGDQRTLELVENPDLLAQLVSRVRNQNLAGRIVGFAAESEIDIDSSQAKLARKGVDYLFVNDVSNQEVFNADSNGGILLGKDGLETPFDYQRKDTLSHALLDVLVKTLG